MAQRAVHRRPARPRRVHPRRQPVSTHAERETRLSATMLNVLVAGMSDPTRLSRGRSYARQGAVIDMLIGAGSLRASVQGSRSAPYDVLVRVRPADGDSMAALVPSARDLSFECSCPDWDDPCKHSIAVMIRFAELVSEDPSTLRRWRGLDLSPSERAVVGSRRLSVEPADVEALRGFLGAPIEVDIPVLQPAALPRDVWDEPWTAMLRSALAALSDR